MSDARMHASLTLSHVMSAVRRNMGDCESYIGFCHACGRKAKQNVEPDARAYPCAFKSCGQFAVFGAEETLLMLPEVMLIPEVRS
jgi:hypothetical protein